VTKKSPAKKINLALQGGGAHGAFTWGVLDAILADPRVEIAAISGASAGAMNAVALAEGYVEDGREGARRQLRRFWETVSQRANFSPIQRSLFNKLLGNWDIEDNPGYLWFEFWSSTLSPYDVGLSDMNPLRDVLRDQIDFSKVRACGAIPLFISATNVETGRVTVFDPTKLDAEHVLASACLPTIFRAIEIEGVPYWDGGYVGNPALFPLFTGSESRDILIVQITRMLRPGVPQRRREIDNRLSEITFNASMLGELRAIEFVQRLVDFGVKLPGDYRRLFLHRIDADAALGDLKPSSKLNAERAFIEMLFERGRASGLAWLDAHHADLGQRDTIDLRSLVLGATPAAPVAADARR
jgi:NTE family protein